MSGPTTTRLCSMPPLLDDLLQLKDVIARKYQRRRASADDVASVDKLIKEHSVEG